MFFGKRSRPLMARDPVETSSAAADLLLSPIQAAAGTPTEQSRVQLGEKELERVAAMAWRVLRRLGVGEHLVADAVQDALVVVHRRLPEFRGESRFDTWVYGILLRVASDYRRRQRRASRVFAPVQIQIEPNIQSDAPNPFEQLEQLEAAEFLRGILAQVPEAARDMFVLVELEELTLGAAAQVLGISESTAKSKLRTARQCFDTTLKRELARRSSG